MSLLSCCEVSCNPRSQVLLQVDVAQLASDDFVHDISGQATDISHLYCLNDSSGLLALSE